MTVHESITAVAVIVTAASLLMPVFVGLGKRIAGGARREPAALPAETNGRLERMEQAIEAMAIEVERISEGQRFVTRLLAEQTDGQGRRLPSEAAQQGGHRNGY